MSDRSTESNTSFPEISRPDAAQEVGDLAFTASLLVGLLEKRSASENTTALAHGLQEHLRDLERALSGHPARPEEGPPEKNAQEASKTPAERDGDSPSGRDHPGENTDRGEESLSATLQQRFETPISPQPAFKPPLVEDVELKLSPETVEMVGRAADSLGPFYHDTVSADLITDVALRELLYGLATDREESILAEWLGRAHGRRQT